MTIESETQTWELSTLDLLGVDVLAARAYDHVLQSPLDVEPAVGIELAQVARAEPAVGSEDLGRGFGILVVSEHDAGREGHDFAPWRVAGSTFSSRSVTPGAWGPVDPRRTIEGAAPASRGAVSVSP